MQDVVNNTSWEMLQRRCWNRNDENLCADVDGNAVLNSGHAARARAAKTKCGTASIGRGVARLECARFRNDQRRDPAGVWYQNRQHREEQRTSHVGRFYNASMADLPIMCTVNPSASRSEKRACSRGSRLNASRRSKSKYQNVTPTCSW